MTNEILAPQPAPAHSAGVWEVLDNRNNRFEPGSVHVIAYGRTIATVAYQLPDAQGETERMANARLIAAAPELLEALDEMLTDIGRANSMPSAVKARAVLKKVKGEAA